MVCRYAVKAVRQEAESFGDHHDPGVAGAVMGARYRANYVRYATRCIRLSRASAESDLSSALNTLFVLRCNDRCREIKIGLGYFRGELTVG